MIPFIFYSQLQFAIIMNKILTLLLVFVITIPVISVCRQAGLTSATEPDTTRNIFEKGLDKIKLQKARHLYLINNYAEALDLYQALYKTSQGNAMLSYRMAECYYKMKHYESAANHLEKAYRIAPDVHKELHLLYGKALHRLDELERAQEHYETCKKQLEEAAKGAIKEALGKNKLLIAEVDDLIERVQYARELTQNPVNVTIENMGEVINSPFEDYGPSLSADGKTMIFTSRRVGSKGGLMAPDHKYYEDIYITTWNEEKNRWYIAEGIQGRLNTDEHDASLSISPDGTMIYVYKNIEGVTKSGDIYCSKLSSSGKWGAPRPLGKTINTTYFESHACVTADAKTLFFISERKNGFGRGDIYMAKRISRKEWSEPQNLGARINTKGDEVSVYVTPDGNTLFFSSEGHKTMGGYDIFKSTYEDGKWTKPVNLGYPINTVGDDVHFVLGADGKKAYYSTFNPNEGLGERDIYEIDMTNYKGLVKK